MGQSIERFLVLLLQAYNVVQINKICNYKKMAPKVSCHRDVFGLLVDQNPKGSIVGPISDVNHCIVLAYIMPTTSSFHAPLSLSLSLSLSLFLLNHALTLTFFFFSFFFSITYSLFLCLSVCTSDRPLSFAFRQSTLQKT